MLRPVKVLIVNLSIEEFKMAANRFKQILDNHRKKFELSGLLAGTGIGAGVGALLGTFVFPGFGTAAGAVIGASFGAASGVLGVSYGRLFAPVKGRFSAVLATIGTYVGFSGTGVLLGGLLATFVIPGIGPMVAGIAFGIAGIVAALLVNQATRPIQAHKIERANASYDSSSSSDSDDYSDSDSDPESDPDNRPAISPVGSIPNFAKLSKGSFNGTSNSLFNPLIDGAENDTSKDPLNDLIKDGERAQSAFQ